MNLKTTITGENNIFNIGISPFKAGLLEK